MLAHQRAGRPAEALRLLEAQLRHDPERAEHPESRRLSALLHADLAEIRAAAGDLPGEEIELRKALAVEPSFPDLHHRLGRVLLRKGDARGARSSFEHALRLAPAYAAARLEVALLEAREGRLGESLAMLRKLGDTRETREPDEFQRGLARLAEADWESGADVLREAFGVETSGVQRQLSEIGVLLADGRDADALVRARALVAAHPRYPDAFLALALVFRERGEWDDCAEACGAALELNPAFHQARVYLAEALSRRGHYGECDLQLAAVFSAEPDHPLALALANALRRGALPDRHRPASH